MSLILGVWGAATFLALITSIVSLWLHLRGDGIHELRSQVRQLALDLEDVYDTVEKWQHRQQVRNMRAGKVDAAAAASLTSQPQRGTPEYKALLRQRASGKAVQ